MIERTIQNIILQNNVRYDKCRDLFYKEGTLVYDEERDCFCISKYQRVDFCTYFNAISYEKWCKYTFVESIRLHLELKGECVVRILGYTVNAQSIVCKELTRKRVLQTDRDVYIDIPSSDSLVVGFVVESLDDVEIYRGEYIGIISDECSDRDIHFSLVMTTYKREEYVDNNVKMLSEMLRSRQYEDLSEHIIIRIIDNGRTIPIDRYQDNHIIVYPNRNCGGSGGFARGMLETIHADIPSDYILLMDDDILIQPESIARLYRLEKYIRPQYAGYMVGGAMLYMDKMCIQQDDTGVVRSGGYLTPLKFKRDDKGFIERLNMSIVDDIVRSEQILNKRKNQYICWWFSLIPTSVVSAQGLPLPLFIKNDDIEYTIRNHADILTMNGICVWHEDFDKKYNPVYADYQYYRNCFISQACFNAFEGVDFYNLWRGTFRNEILRFQYGSARLVLRAMEDYLKGPEYLEKLDGIENIKELESYLPSIVDSRELESVDIDQYLIQSDEPRNTKDKLLYHITANGHRLYPTSRLKRIPAFIPDGYQITVQKQTLRRTLIAVNPYTLKARVYTYDKNEYKELMSEYKKVRRIYKKKRKHVDVMWQKQSEYLTSEKFWKNYLEVNNCCNWSD